MERGYAQNTLARLDLCFQENLSKKAAAIQQKIENARQSNAKDEKQAIEGEDDTVDPLTAREIRPSVAPTSAMLYQYRKPTLSDNWTDKTGKQPQAADVSNPKQPAVASLGPVDDSKAAPVAQSPDKSPESAKATAPEAATKPEVVETSFSSDA